MATALDYKTTALALVRPPSKFVSTHRVRTDAEYAALLEQAQSAGLLLYSAVLQQQADGWYALPPWRLDERSLAHEPAPAQAADHLICPECGKICYSTSGLTLHRKSHSQ